MAPLRYSINVTLDGCYDHLAVVPDEELHRHAAQTLSQADTLLFGRVTYEMMRSAFGPGAPSETDLFAQAIGPIRKHVVSSTIQSLDWDAELLRGDLADGVRRLKEQSATGVYVGGVTLPLALAQLGLIDEYEILVHPRVAGRGPALFAGLSAPLDLELVSQDRLGSGAAVLRYVPRRRPT